MDLNTLPQDGPSEDAAGSPSEEEMNAEARSSAVETWNDCIRRYHKMVLVFVIVILWPFGFVAFKGLSNKTDSSFRKPIPNSPSAIAQAALERKFPGSLQDPLTPSIFVVLHDDDANATASIVEHPYVQNRSQGLQEYLSESNTTTTMILLQVTSYVSFQQQNLTLLARPFLSSNKQTTLIQIQYHAAEENHKTKVTKDLMQLLDEYFQKPPIQVYVTGLKYFSNDLRLSTKQDLKRMDMIVLPLALILVGVALLGWTKGFCFIWIIPLCGMITTVSLWSLLTNLMADHVQITQFTPSIMMSLTLGMGIDYTLFLLARYLEKRQDQAETSCTTILTSSLEEQKYLATLDMLKHGGLVVVLSGCTLLCTFLGLIGLPLVMLQSVGIGAAIAIASAIVANLLVVPSLLYTPLGEWILPSVVMNEHLDETEDPSVPSGEEEGDREQEQNTMTQPLLMEDPCLEEIPAQLLLIEPRQSVWIWLSRHILHPYKSIICLLLLSQLLFSPLAWNALEIKSADISFEALLPSNAPSLLAYKQMSDLGGPGRLAPFRILLDGTSGSVNIDSKTGFDAMHQLIQELKHISNNSSSDSSLPAATFSGIAVVENVPIPYTFYTAAKQCSAQSTSSFCELQVVRALNVIDNSVTSTDRKATFLTVELSLNPFADSSVLWLDLVRERIESLRTKGPLREFDVYIEGTAAIAHDAVTAVYNVFPWVVAIMITVVFCLLGLFFGSIVPPLRSVVSITCTVSASFGLAVLVYQDGLLNSTHIRSFVVLDPELCWLVPIMSFSIMVGLALDYDVFLVTRILEFRCAGYQHESSIAAGLDATGGIITAAGVIMAISFGSLLSSPSPALNQWSFLLTTAVLIDTFVVRTMVVPSLMAIVDGKFAWYPRKLDAGRIRFTGFDDSPDDENTERN